VLAAVANPARRIRRLVAAEGARKRLQAAAAAAPAARPAVEATERRALEALLPPGAVHQGMAALAAPLPELSLQDLLDRLKDDGRCVRLVVLDQATDPRNVGAVIRSVAAFRAAAVLTQDRHAPSATGALAKAAAGGLERVPLVGVVNLARALRTLRDAGFCCIGLDAEAGLTLAALPRAERTALVLGSEGRGLRRLVRDSCDLLARIPIAAGSESLNLSAAAAIGLYELARDGGGDGG
jgi:23S rRNA (guanosine2251-2'-O)-methyltransferase